MHKNDVSLPTESTTKTQDLSHCIYPSNYLLIGKITENCRKILALRFYLKKKKEADRIRSIWRKHFSGMFSQICRSKISILTSMENKQTCNCSSDNFMYWMRGNHTTQEEIHGQIIIFMKCYSYTP